MDLLAHLAEGVFPPDAKARIVALLFGYFDESGTDGQHNFTVITGFVGPLSEWSSLRLAWDAQLKKDGIETFHYVECKGRNKQYRGWNWEAQCKPHLESLAGSVSSHGVAGLNAAFSGDYSQVLKNVHPDFAARYPTAYSLCFEMLIARLRQACQQWKPEPVMLIFAAHQQYSGLALERWNEAKKHNTWPEIIHIGYSEPDQVHQLQVADMLAWETRRYMWEKTSAEQIVELPLLSEIIAKHQRFGGSLYEASMTEEIVLQMADDLMRGPDV